MPLPGNPRRLAAERVLRSLVLLVLVVSLGLAWRIDNRAPAERATTATLRSQLERWTTRIAPARVAVEFTALPSLVERDWLAALDGAGTALSWRGEGLSPLAVALRPLADPRGTSELVVSAPGDTSVVVGNSGGRVDTLRLSAGSVRVRLLPGPHPLEVTATGVVAAAVRRDSLPLRRALVLGRAGWETRFLVAALEQRGWQVDVHYTVAPFADIRQGVVTAADLKAPPAPLAAAPTAAPPGFAAFMRPLRMAPGMMPMGGPAAPAAGERPRSVTPIDTARYAVVLAVDSSAAREASRLVRYVRSGGGLVLLPGAASSPSLASLRVGTLGTSLGAQRMLPADSARTGLELRPLQALSPEAAILERRQAHVAVAARLEGAGRTAQVGYVDLWRWRMTAGPPASEQYGDWISRLVAGVAYAPALPVAAAPTDPAPLANLIDRLGPGDGGITENPEDLWRRLLPWIFGILCLASLIEWTSRRTRGTG